MPPFLVEMDRDGKLSEYFSLLAKNRWLVALSAAIGIGFGILLSTVQKPMFRAQAAVEIQDFNDNFLNKGFDNSNSGSDTAETNFQTQIRLLQTESLLERVANRLHLHDTPTHGPAKPSFFRTLLRLPQPALMSERERVLKQMAQSLTVRVSGQTRVVEILYESPDPTLASQVANTLVNEFIEQSQEVRWKSNQRTGQWLTLQLAEMKIKLERSEAQLQTMAKASGLLLDSGKDSIEDARLRQLEDQLSRVQAERLQRQSNVELAGRAPIESLPEVIDDPVIRDYSIKLADLRRQKATLDANLTPAHYRVQEVQRQIDAMVEAIERARANVLNRLRNEFETVEKHERLLEDACEQQMQVVAKASGKAVQYNMLKHEVDTSRQLYEVLLQRVKEAGVASAMRAGNVLIVDPAKPPLLPYKPNILMISAVGCVGGLFIGIAFLLVREQSNKSVRDPGELSRQLNLPELGAIPAAAPRFLNIGLYPFKQVAASIEPRVDPQREECLELVTWNRKPSFMAESFRATLPSILLSGSTDSRPRVLVVTSPNPAEGKTTVATNLAIAISEITGRVLIVDGDLRRPRLHSIFKANRENGLGELLSSDESLTKERILGVVQTTGIVGLELLTSGREPEETSSLFYSKRLPELLTVLRATFDTVVIDSPPLLQIPDGRLLARFADGLIMVVRAGRTDRESALIAHQRVAEDGTRVLGTILNSWDPGGAHRYSYAK